MASEKQLPFSIATQVDSFLLGLSLEAKYESEEALKKEIQASKTIQKIDDDIRKYYDRYVPNIHILNVYSIANIIINNLAKYPEKLVEADTGSESNKLSSEQLKAIASDIVANTLAKNSPGYNSLVNAIRKSISEYHSKVTNVSAPNPIVTLNELAVNLFNRVRSEIILPATALSIGVRFSQQINAVFGNRAVIGVIDKELGSSRDTYIFFSRSFDSIKPPINERLNTVISDELNKIFKTNKVKGVDITSKKSQFIGYVVNFGHSLIQNEVGSYINSPAYASSIFGVAQGRSKVFTKAQTREASKFFKEESRLIETTIEVSKNFTTSGYAGALLALGITITQPEDWKENQTRGTMFEKQAIKKLSLISVVSRSSRSIQALKTRLIKLAKKQKLTPDGLIHGRSSNSLIDYIELAIANAIQGIATPVEKKKISRSVKTQVKRLVPTKTKPTVLNNPSGIQKSIVPLDIIKPSFKAYEESTSLVSLESLLNTMLSEKIRQNMGSGNRSDVLNYRTGRFAESAKIEKISRSRDGMITAFYTYMKNPYATFSAGGIQESPRSRDPKLLIARSIREIGAELAYNRMRAVLV